MKRWRIKLCGPIPCTVALMALLAGPMMADDGDYSGNALLSKCTEVLKILDGDKEADLYEGNFCFGFVRASYQGVITTAYVCDSEKFCAPDDITNGQAVRIVVKYLKDHPKDLHQDAFFLAFAAFVEAFPCKTRD